jgi:hypothetical protein
VDCLAGERYESLYKGSEKLCDQVCQRQHCSYQFPKFDQVVHGHCETRRILDGTHEVEFESCQESGHGSRQSETSEKRDPSTMVWAEQRPALTSKRRL